MQTVIGVRKIQDKVIFVGEVTVAINGEKMPDFFAGIVNFYCDTFALMNGADNEIKLDQSQAQIGSPGSGLACILQPTKFLDKIILGK